MQKIRAPLRFTPGQDQHLSTFSNGQLPGAAGPGEIRDRARALQVFEAKFAAKSPGEARGSGSRRGSRASFTLRQLSLGPHALPATHECTTSGAGESGPPPRPSRVAGQALEGAEHALVAVGAAGTVTVRRFGGARRLRRTPGADRAVTAGRRPHGTTPRL